MKSQLLKTFLCAMAAGAFVSSIASAGPGVSSGGDSIVTQSSLKDTVWILSRVRDLMDPKALDNNFYDIMFKDQESLRDGELKGVLAAFFAGTKMSTWGAYESGSALENDIAKSPIEVREKGPCLSEDGSKVDAAVMSFTPGTKICFSAERLARVPREALRAQVQALSIHERAHHFGFAEPAAVKVQHYFLDEVLTGRAFLRSRLRFDLVEDAKSIVSHLKSGEKYPAGDSAGFRLSMLGTFLGTIQKDLTNLDTMDFTSQPVGYYKKIADRLFPAVAGKVQSIADRSDTQQINAAQAAEELDRLMSSLSELQSKMRALIKSEY